MSYDVIVVGAGPAGSAAASECARLGLKTLCLEEHGTIGYPVQCAGLLSNAAFAECRVSERSVLNRVSGARVRSGRGHEILIDTGTTRAVVVDRGALDREMAEAAAGAGAEFRLRTAVYGVRGHTVLTRGVNGHEEQSSDLLIAADGPRSTIARLLGMERAPVFLAGIQADIAHECDPRLVELYPDASPDFFGWSVPTSGNRIRVGLCGKTQVPQRFEALMKTFGPAGSTNLVTGTLPLGIMPRTYGHRTLFVGDAAGFAKPTSGGGIYTGVRSARHAAAVAAESCERGRFDDAALAGYEQKWQADFGKELRLGFRLFGMRQRMSDGDIDAFITALNDPPVIRIIEEYFDMDRPGTVIGKLLLNPAMIRLLRPLFLSGLKSLF
ncbi:MAG: NAD(P)/FAD-dependent oxidoreductase [Methanoregula sp.]|jgi:geranylgeranyl reductase family protein|uniref:NAD(P)/FAD-dependent oxidoreductase n=1 Tax=Methanoregula sp. TaxID=2052170 RepID=UPI003D14CE47